MGRAEASGGPQHVSGPISPRQYQDDLLTSMLQTFLGGAVAPATVAFLREHLQWVEVAGGETLVTQGEAADFLYFSISGRLRAYVRNEDGSQGILRDMARGQVIGEISMYTDEPRTATVIAIRDSVLVRLGRLEFHRLLALDPQISLALTRQVINRLRTEEMRNVSGVPVAIGVVPITDGIDLADFALRLAQQLAKAGRACVIDSAAMNRKLQEAGIAEGQRSSRKANRRIAMLLDEIESAHDFVLLVADDEITEWTLRCIRHCDELLLVANADRPPVLHPIERECLVQGRPHLATEVLILLHASDVRSPRNTARWLARRPVDDHVHVRPMLERDMARLGRIQSRTAVGLVLAGGGARGFAHLGVYRALQEHGVEVDCVCGTSIGSVMGTLVACDRPLGAIMAVAKKAFGVNPTGDFNAIPMLSLIKGHRLRATIARAMDELIGVDADLEDLWKNTCFVATNYSKAAEHVARHGSLAEAMLASIAIPGALPPVIHDGDLLCDGGTFNNFPVDVVRRMRGVRRVVGVDLNCEKLIRIDLDAVPGSWALLLDRLRPQRKRRYALPSLAAYLMNVTVLYSMSRQRRAYKDIDLYFRPPLERVGMLEWKKFDQTVQQGYEHACEVLGAWREKRRDGWPQV